MKWNHIKSNHNYYYKISVSICPVYHLDYGTVNWYIFFYLTKSVYSMLPNQIKSNQIIKSRPNHKNYIVSGFRLNCPHIFICHVCSSSKCKLRGVTYMEPVCHCDNFFKVGGAIHIGRVAKWIIMSAIMHNAMSSVSKLCVIRYIRWL